MCSRQRRLVTGLGLALLIGTAGTSVRAQSPASPAASIAQDPGAASRPRMQVNVGREAPRGAEARHHRTLVQALEALQRDGYRGLQRRLPDLRRALDAAPAVYPAFEQADRRWIVRSDDLSDVLMMATAVSGSGEAAGKASIDVVQQTNVYPMLAFLLGAEAVERKAYDEAIPYLDRGLALQPHNVPLIAEKAIALQGKERWAEALALVDTALASGDLLLIMHSAPLHRRRGSSLLGLGRLSDARAAFQTSLETEPGHPAAVNELAYITQLEAGGPPRASVIVANPPPPAD